MFTTITTATITSSRKKWMKLSYTLLSSIIIMQISGNTVVAQEPVVCDCGFQDEYDRVWNEIWYADYASYNTDLQKDKNYLVMDYTVPAKHVNTIDRIFDPNNVQVIEDGGIHLNVKKTDTGGFTSASFGTRRYIIHI